MLEVLLVQTPALADMASMLMIARTWRFVRVGHGLFASVNEASSKKVPQASGTSPAHARITLMRMLKITRRAHDMNMNMNMIMRPC